MQFLAIYDFADGMEREYCGCDWMLVKSPEILENCWQTVSAEDDEQIAEFTDSMTLVQKDILESVLGYLRQTLLTGPVHELVMPRPETDGNLLKWVSSEGRQLGTGELNNTKRSEKRW